MLAVLFVPVLKKWPGKYSKSMEFSNLGENSSLGDFQAIQIVGSSTTSGLQLCVWSPQGAGGAGSEKPPLLKRT